MTAAPGTAPVLAHAPRLAIVGAGIVGLAHALAARRRGWQVSVFERDHQPRGASVRNFGLGLLLGQAEGKCLELARRSRAIWLDLLPRIGAWHKARGSLTVARDDAERAVLQAFQEDHGAQRGTRWLAPEDFASVGAAGVRGLGGLFSPHELAMASREVMPALAAWLERQGVVFHWGCPVQHVEGHSLWIGSNGASGGGVVRAAGRFDADAVLICSGHEHQTLGLDGPQPAGLQRCALQMLRVRAPGLHLAPALMTGLSALHYPAFLERPALAAPLTALRSQIERQQPALIEHGIHLIVQQLEPSGELIIGDSHRYGGDVSPFSSEAIDQALLGLAGDLLGCGLQVLERWQGVYGSGPRPFERLALADRVEAVWITSGIGMSVAPALAEQVIGEMSAALGVEGDAA